ncbi:MAG: hypothetical protein WB992_26530 [Bryobacteraceae bacterium]
MKETPEYIEGSEAFMRFKGAMKAILSVPREEILRREAEYKKQAALNPRKRGPKPKRKSVSPDPAV